MLRLFPSVEYVVFRETQAGWRIPDRQISNHELVFVAEGKGYVRIRGRDFTVCANDVLYFYPGMPHSLWVGEPPFMKFFGVHFSFSDADGAARLPMEDIVHLPGLNSLSAALKELTRVWAEKDYLHVWRQDLLFSQVLYALIDRLHRQEAPADVQKIAAVIDHIHRRPTQPFTLEQLRTVSGMGKSCFMRSFRAVTGDSPVHYANRMRLEFSKDALLGGRDSIRSIAERFGFSDEGYYSRLFRETFGLAPSEFRSRNRD